MTVKVTHRTYQIMAIHSPVGWDCFIAWKPFCWLQSTCTFENSNYAIAYGKEQINKLLANPVIKNL